MPTIGAFAAVFDDRRRMLFVRRAYGPKNWTNPGGRMDPGESIIEAVEREAYEETGYRVSAGELIGAYSAPFKDDMVMFIEAVILGRDEWSPNSEIAEVRFFARDDLPQLHGRQTPGFRTRARDGEASYAFSTRSLVTGAEHLGRLFGVTEHRRSHFAGHAFGDADEGAAGNILVPVQHATIYHACVAMVDAPPGVHSDAPKELAKVELDDPTRL